MSMTHERILLDRVATLRTRVRLLVTQQWVCTCVTLALLASLGLVAVSRLGWWTDAVEWIWAIVLAGAVVGFTLGWTRRISPLVAAQVVDERGGLKERLSTAVELSHAPERSAVAEAQIADAADHAAALRPAQVLPWRPPPQGGRLLAAAGLLAAGLWLPDLPLFHSAQAQKDREAIRQEGERLQQVAKEMEKRLPSANEDNAAIMRRINQEMKRLGKDMRTNRIPKKQAMLRANELQKELKEAEARQSAGEAKRSLEGAAKDLEAAAQRQEGQGDRAGAEALKRMAESVGKDDMAGARRQLEDLARKLQSGELNPQDMARAQKLLEEMAKSLEGSRLDQASREMKEAAKQLQEASESAKRLAEKLAAARTDEERKEIQEQAARELQQQADRAAAECRQAGGACKNGGGSQMAKDLQQASDALRSAQQSLQQAGQDQGQQGQSANASQGEMGEEFGQSGSEGKDGQRSGQGQQGKAGQAATASGQAGKGTGAGLGGPGRGAGGGVGAQQPLPGKKKDVLVPGSPDARGKHLTRSYMGTPDPSEDRAAYYSIVPEKVRAAEASLGREDIPAAVKKPVQKYFESIRPQR